MPGAPTLTATADSEWGPAVGSGLHVFSLRMSGSPGQNRIRSTECYQKAELKKQDKAEHRVYKKKDTLKILEKR